MTNDTKIKGIKLRNLSRAMIISSTIIFICLIIRVFSISVSYKELIKIRDEYNKCRNDAISLQAASDYLTQQVRLYVINGDLEYLNNYFYEVNVAQRREKAIEELETHNPDAQTSNYLKAALNESNNLMKQEYHAMKLVSVANSVDSSLLVDEINNFNLPTSETFLSKEESLNKATSLVFDKNYLVSKETISNDLNKFNESILSIINAKEKTIQDELSLYLRQQGILILILFIINILIFVIITSLVVKPLVLDINHVKKGEMLEIIGAYEFKYMAATYNDIYQKNAITNALLQKEATHDPLTGLMNRGTFNKLKSDMEKQIISLAFIIIDIDNFKTINDTYGHEYGDRALVKVADELKQTFRLNDYKIRLGGDEFAIILPEITITKKQAILEKLKEINEKLNNPLDESPKVSFSAGIAFSEDGFNNNLYASADKALYEIKRNGKNSFKFVDEIVK